MYVIQDTRTGSFVAYPGSPSSFTKDILKARQFATKESADRERCPQSERVVSVYELLGR